MTFRLSRKEEEVELMEELVEEWSGMSDVYFENIPRTRSDAAVESTLL